MSRVKATAKATVNTTAKKSISIDEINASVKKAHEGKEVKATANKTTAKQSNKTAKQSKAVKTDSMRQFKQLLQLDDATAIKQLRDAIEKDDFRVELKKSTACILFIVDSNKNTVCNVYDNFRIQFTTVQARKYKDELLKNNSFYTFTYKQNEFISCKCNSIEEFYKQMNFVYTVYMKAKQTATATKEVKTDSKAK